MNKYIYTYIYEYIYLYIYLFNLINTLYQTPQQEKLKMENLERSICDGVLLHRNCSM